MIGMPCTNQTHDDMILLAPKGMALAFHPVPECLDFVSTTHFIQRVLMEGGRIKRWRQWRWRRVSSLCLRSRLKSIWENGLVKFVVMLKYHYYSCSRMESSHIFFFSLIIQLSQVFYPFICLTNIGVEWACISTARASGQLPMKSFDPMRPGGRFYAAHSYFFKNTTKVRNFMVHEDSINEE